jgi:hypothetical protein
MGATAPGTVGDGTKPVGAIESAGRTVVDDDDLVRHRKRDRVEPRDHVRDGPLLVEDGNEDRE